MTPIRARRRAVPGTVAAAVLVGAALAVPGGATASPATVTLQAMEPSYGPVSIATTGGGRVDARLGWFRLGVAAPAAPTVVVRGFCDDPGTPITQGRAYAVDLRDAGEAPDLATPGYAGVSWLVRSSERLIGAAANPGREAAAIQVAVWKLGGRVPAAARSGDAALDRRVDELRAQAATAAAPRPTAATPAGEATACAGTGSVRVDVVGAPGATATVAVSAPATVDATRVVLDRAGTAHVVVRAATPGAVTVHVDVEAGDLVRAARRPGTSGGPQETVFVRPASAAVDVPVTFRDCTSPQVEPGGGGTPEEPGTGTPGGGTPTAPAGGPSTPAGSGTPAVPATPTGPQGTPGTPVVPPKDTPVTPGGDDSPRGQQAPRLVLRKTAPARVGLGGRIRYTIEVRNRGRGAATGVLVRDPLPLNTVLAGTPAGAELTRGALLWRIGRLAPNGRRTLRVTLRVPEDRTGRVCNAATVTGDGGLRATARVCTVVTGRPRPLIPSVTD